jgi:hypothetical protein
MLICLYGIIAVQTRTSQSHQQGVLPRQHCANVSMLRQKQKRLLQTMASRRQALNKLRFRKSANTARLFLQQLGNASSPVVQVCCIVVFTL